MSSDHTPEESALKVGWLNMAGSLNALRRQDAEQTYGNALAQCVYRMCKNVQSQFEQDQPFSQHVKCGCKLLSRLT